MKQGSLFQGTVEFQTLVISRRRDFEGLFTGFFNMQAISYVTSPDLLMEFFDKGGYGFIEIVVGESMAPARLTSEWKQDLLRKGLEVSECLSDKVESGALRILVPERTLHSKFYLLEKEGTTRIIVSSANLTESARQAKQVNYAWFVDLSPEHPFLRRVKKDYEAHRTGAEPFMGDLVELLKERRDTSRREVVEAWLKGTVGGDQEGEMRRVFHEVSLAALEPTHQKEEPLITVRLPENTTLRKQVERVLSPITQGGSSGALRVNGTSWIRYVEENHGLPILQVDREKRRVLLGFTDSRMVVTEPLPDAGAIGEALQHVEDYVNTVDCCQTTDPRFAKMSLYEALLFVLFAPFANEYMKRKRSVYGNVDTRGPRFLYIYGPSQNGKSTFLRFALKLLSGKQIQPLTGNQFTKTKLFQATTLGTAFPLIFDDVVALHSTSTIEEILKSYWETWWKSEFIQPQIVLSSNVRTLKEWAKSRVKRVNFDMHFAPTERDKERLAKIFNVENPLFHWFSTLYMERLEESESVSDDELYLARTIMKDLYQRARRILPEFFPSEPIEKIYDPGRKDWDDLLYGLKKGRMVREKGRLLIEFPADVPFWEVGEYQTSLPQTVKSKRRGNTLVIESPGEFKSWMEGGHFRRLRWFDRWFKR